LVQRIVPLEREHVAVRLTTARYYTPFGRNLQRDDRKGVRGGLVPDETVATDDAEKEAVRKWLDEQVGLNWDLLPLEGDDSVRPRDGVLKRAVAMLKDAAAVERELGK
ncbi:MAG: hypothetical protein ACYTG4_04690, partial [Planctomycetota bacterium]